VCDPATSASAEPDIGGHDGVVRHGIWWAAAAGTAWIRGNRDQITQEEEDLPRKSRKREEIAWGAVYWRAGSLAKAGKREDQVSEEAILATHLVRLLEGWIRA
jgi:hypothetical protein